MKTLFATGVAFMAMASVSLAQQPPAPPTASPPAQVQPSAPLAAVPEVMNAPGDAPPGPRHDVPPPPGPGPGPGDYARRGHDGHRPPPPPPSKAAHFRIEDGSTKIDIKCADDEPTKVCSDVLLQILDKLAPPADNSDDGRD